MTAENFDPSQLDSILADTNLLALFVEIHQGSRQIDFPVRWCERDRITELAAQGKELSDKLSRKGDGSLANTIRHWGNAVIQSCRDEHASNPATAAAILRLAQMVADAHGNPVNVETSRAIKIVFTAKSDREWHHVDAVFIPLELH